MLNNVKFMKKIMCSKKKLDSFGTISLSKNCSAIIKRKLPKKLRDLGSFTIPCVIGEHIFKKALCDLGANINVMPLFVAKKLNLGESTPIALSLQMANCSLTYPQGIIEDVLVKVDKFMFLVDFVVLDMEKDKEAPLILGRPFLAAGKTLIDVENRELSLRVDNDQIKFNLDQNLKFASNDKTTCMRIDSLIPSRDGLMHEYMNRDPLEECLTCLLSIEELKNEQEASNLVVVETILTLEESEEAVVFEEEPITPHGLVLKELPTHLCYAFLGQNSTKQVTISTSMNDEMEKEPLLVLKKYSGDFAWCIDDIKGISPLVSMN